MQALKTWENSAAFTEELAQMKGATGKRVVSGVPENTFTWEVRCTSHSCFKTTGEDQYDEKSYHRELWFWWTWGKRLTSTQAKTVFYTELSAHLRHTPDFGFPASIPSMETNHTWMKWKPSSFLEDVTPSYMLTNQIWVEAKQQGNFKLFWAVCFLGSFPR